MISSAMDPTSDMESMREQIRAALDAAPDKSRKELAKLLSVSPAQVSSLLKPGGRRLQAAEVPIVERYLGISLLRGHWRPLQEGHANYFVENEISKSSPPQQHAIVAELARPPPRPMGQPSPRGGGREGTPVALADLPAELSRYLGSVIGSIGAAAEVWRIATDLVEAAGYLPGDYLVVDRGEKPRPRDVVLAELRENLGPAIPVFRAYLPPYLMTANPKAMMQSPLYVDDVRVTIIGVIVGSVRKRGG